MSAQATEVVRPMAEAPIEDIVRFHGHMCPGLAMGIRAAEVDGPDRHAPRCLRNRPGAAGAVRQGPPAHGLGDRARALRGAAQARSQAILEAPEQDLYKVDELAGVEVPARARIHRSVTCAECGEPTMETRIRRLEGRELCPDCFERALAA